MSIHSDKAPTPERLSLEAGVGAFAAELAVVHEKAGIGGRPAPVLGRPDVAKRGRLTILAAGRRQAVETVRPLLEVPSRTVLYIG